WIDQALALPSAAPRTGIRAKALIAAGSLAYWQQDRRATSTSFGEALAIVNQIGDEAGIAAATYSMAFALSIDRRVDQAVEMFQASRAMFEVLGDRGGVADSLFGLSIASRLQGELATARAAGEEALRIHEALSDFFGF